MQAILSAADDIDIHFNKFRNEIRIFPTKVNLNE